MRKLFLLMMLTHTICLYAQPPLVFTGFDLNTGENGSGPYQFTVYKDHFVFGAFTDSTGVEIWISDGTKNGTHLLKDLFPGKESSLPNGFIVLKDKLYFVAEDSIAGKSLWVTNGTEDGTQQIKQFAPYSMPGNFYPVLMGDHIYFSTTDNQGSNQLWISDGTTIGTYTFKNIDNSIWYPYDLTTYSHYLIFSAFNGSGNLEPWISDGTTAGTHLLKDIYPGPSPSDPSGYTPFKGKLFFTTRDSLHGHELWATDGTENGTYMVKDIVPGPSSGADYIGLTVFNGRLYLNARDSTGYRLWASDGTEAGTQPVTKLQAIHYETSRAIYHDKLYITGRTSDTGGNGLFYTDGTDSGTHELLSPLSNGGAGPTNLTVYKNTLYFISDIWLNKNRMYRYNGTTLDTIIHTPLTDYPFRWSYNNKLFEYKGAIWLCAMLDSTGYELWKMEDTSNPAQDTVLPFTIFPNPNDGSFTLNTGYKDFNGVAMFYDAAGKLVGGQNINGSTAQLTINAPAAGIYFMRLSSNKGLHTYKIVVNK